MVMAMHRLRAWCWVALIAGACGGKAVVDPPAEGIGGSSSTSSSTTSSSTTSSSGTGGTADPCPLLDEQLEAALRLAQACNPMINAIQCSGQAVVYDTCGCQVVANDQASSEAEAALEAYDAWVQAGCGPQLCSTCPPGPETPWYCDVDLEVCTPAYE